MAERLDVSLAVYRRIENNKIILTLSEKERLCSSFGISVSIYNDIYTFVKSNTDEKNPLEIIVKLRSRKLNNFELDREIYEAINEFYSYIEKYKELKTNENFMNINFGLAETESEIIAFRKYYNDIITDYNKMVKTFPSNIVSLFCHYSYRPYFDGKDMNDEKHDEVKL